MGRFIKDFDVYKSKNVNVYINQCHKRKGKKTYIYSVRKDDLTGMGELLALIKWNGAWRQYCLLPFRYSLEQRMS